MITGEITDRVEAEAVNKQLFNKDSVDKVLEHLMTRGLKVRAVWDRETFSSDM